MVLITSCRPLAVRFCTYSGIC